MEYEKCGLLHDMFKRQAEKTPANVAVVSADGRQMTYKELDDVTDLLATYLRIKGVVPDTNVGIYIERCIEYTISYIAILKAGGAYMPMDVSYPLPLLEDILSDAQPVAVFTVEDLAHNIKGAKNIILYNDGWLDRIKAEVANSDAVPTGPPNLTLDNLAYTVYSSGTTGKPKGIQCPHRGAVFSYHWRHENILYQKDEREAANVFFTWEMFRPLCKGATLYIIPDTVIYDPRLLCDYLKTHKITRILFTPSLLEAVLNLEQLDFKEATKTLKVIIFCGEVVTTALLDRCMELMPWVEFHNLYSISEAHDITCANLSQWYHSEKSSIKNVKFCPVGKLFSGVHIVILNEELQPQPVGVAGEIYIGGPTLARGYLNRPQINAERFIARPKDVPAKVGQRLYKTGDWGYMLSDGSFEICGRCDSMVKIRGYSIETQAIEKALNELPMVNNCAVLALGEEGQDKFLAAYIVPEYKTTKKEVRSELKKILPFYMIPSYFIFLEKLPVLAASAKLDKKQLPPVDKEHTSDSEEGAPVTQTEHQLVPLWKEVLQLNWVDVQESFFDMGGHSLLAARLLGKVKDVFGVQLAVKDLFVHSTVSAMAKLVEVKLDRTDHSVLTTLIPELDLVQEVNRHDQAFLDIDISLRAFWRSISYHGDRWKRGRALLTGATGFLGSFLLRDLLLKTKARVFCLVRKHPGEKSKARLRSSMVQYGMLPSSGDNFSEEQRVLDKNFANRVTAMKGDVGLVNMGLSDDDFTYLSTEIDFIIHAAAYVNLIYPYKALHGPNVLGTQNIVRFACTTKIKPLHHISTNAVFPHGLRDCSETDNMLQYADQLVDGYTQTKWVAEQLVQRAMDRGLPVAIYRLGNLSGDSRNAYWNPQDFNLLMIQGCLATGCAPDVAWQVEMTPVDFVSTLVVSLTQDLSMALGKVLHVTNTRTMASSWLFEWLSAHGYPLKILNYNDWIQQVISVQAEDKTNSLLQRLLESMAKDASYFARSSTYKQDNLEMVLKNLKLCYPQLDYELLKTYSEKLAGRNIIPKIRRPTTAPKSLAGRVAIVTGASSGIGAAIAKTLAEAGAKVAMVARRVDRLKELKESIEKDGGVTIAVRCDVTDRNQVGEMVKHTEYTLGVPDMLINSAGVMFYTMMKNLKEDQWHQQVDVNCKGTLHCVAAVLDGMLKTGHGHILNISSDAGRRGFAGLAVYSGTKFFIEGFSQGMRAELANTGVKVTCIQPGDVKTELLNHNSDKEARDAYDGSSSTTILEADDIARAVLYAVTQPPFVAVNEILIEPREAPI